MGLNSRGGGGKNESRHRQRMKERKRNTSDTAKEMAGPFKY